MNLADRVRQLREARGWDQKRLAEASGVDRSVISLMERDGRNGARPDTLVRLAGAFGVTVGYLLGVEEVNLLPYEMAIREAIASGIGPDDLVILIQNAKKPG